MDIKDESGDDEEDNDEQPRFHFPNLNRNFTQDLLAPVGNLLARLPELKQAEIMTQFQVFVLKTVMEYEAAQGKSSLSDS